MTDDLIRRARHLVSELDAGGSIKSDLAARTVRQLIAALEAAESRLALIDKEPGDD